VSEPFAGVHFEPLSAGSQSQGLRVYRLTVDSASPVALATSPRDAIVAGTKCLGQVPPQKRRPVGYGVIRAGVRTDSMIGVTTF
jgi:hypothetical protein